MTVWTKMLEQGNRRFILKLRMKGIPSIWIRVKKSLFNIINKLHLRLEYTLSMKPDRFTKHE